MRWAAPRGRGLRPGACRCHRAGAGTCREPGHRAGHGRPPCAPLPRRPVPGCGHSPPPRCPPLHLRAAWYHLTPFSAPGDKFFLPGFRGLNSHPPTAPGAVPWPRACGRGQRGPSPHPLPSGTRCPGTPAGVGGGGGSPAAGRWRDRRAGLMEPIPLIDSISAAAGCGARSHQFDSGDGESDLERPRHQLAVIDGIAHWKPMGSEAGSGSCIPSNPRSRTGPRGSRTRHPPWALRGPLGPAWHSPGGPGRRHGQPPCIPARGPRGLDPQHPRMGVPRCPTPLTSPHGGPLGRAPASTPTWGLLGTRLLPASRMRVSREPPPHDSITPGGAQSPQHPPQGTFPQGTAPTPGPSGCHGGPCGRAGAPGTGWVPAQGRGAGCAGGRAGSGAGGGARRGRCFRSGSCQAVSPEKP